MISNILPVRFPDSTGGTFIAALLNYARDNIPIPKKLSSHGNAHAIPMILGNREITWFGKQPPNQFWFEEQEHKLPEISKDIGPSIVFYLPLHNARPYPVNFFQKYINITYSSTSIPKLMQVNFFKNLIDSHQYDRNTIDLLSKKQQEFYFFRLGLHQPLIQEHILNLDWETKILGDPDLLIDKLSTFCNIKKSNFDKEYLIEWQRITKGLFS